jgi:hypothetical protein
MKPTLLSFAAILAFTSVIASRSQVASTQRPDDRGSAHPPYASSQVAPAYGKLPLSFEANDGQTNQQVKFLAKGNGYSLFLTDSSAVLALRTQGRVDQKSGATTPRTDAGARKSDVVQMELVGASRATHPTGVEGLPGKANYLIGNDRTKWRTNIASFAKVQYGDVYPGIDLVY